MRVFAIFVALLFLPLASALSDLTVYAEGHYENQEEAPILVEWFHGDEDQEQLKDLVEMDRNGEITLLHWRTGAKEEGGGFPEGDANARMMSHAFNQTPAAAIDGYPEHISDLKPSVNVNEVETSNTFRVASGHAIKAESAFEIERRKEVRDDEVRRNGGAGAHYESD